VLVIASDHSDTLIARRITFPYAVRAAAYDSASGMLVVSYEEDWKPARGGGDRSGGERISGGQGITESNRPVVEHETAAYDLRNRRLDWAIHHKALVAQVLRDRILMIADKKGALLRASEVRRSPRSTARYSSCARADG
jgi:hypothetical protein